MEPRCLRHAAVLAAALSTACRVTPAPGTPPDKPGADRPVPPVASKATTPAPAPPAIEPHGARGDGETDDRVALQAAIDQAASSRGEVALPAGTFLVSAAGKQPYALKVPSGVQLHGAGRDKTVLRLAPHQAPSVRLLLLTGDDISLEDLTLDGNKAAQTPNEQRHGIFAQDAERLSVRRVVAQNFTGDGFYLYKGAGHATFSDVLATANDRNGITLGGALDGTVLEHSKFAGNRGQQVDSEPGGADVVSNTRVVDCDLDGAGVSNEYVLTCSGTAAKTPGHGWTVTRNRIGGGIFVVWAEHVEIADNRFVNPTTKPSVTVYRSSADVAITGNQIQQTAPGVAGIAVTGTAASGPQRVTIARNTIETTSEKATGINAAGAQSVVITDNVLRGAGRPARGASGIELRATNPDVDFESAVVKNNRISNFGWHGITVMGNGKARLLSVEITGNTFEDTAATPAMTEAISLDDGTGAARQVTVIGNQLLGGVTTPITHYPPDVPVLVGGVRGQGGRYEIAGSPEGNLPEAAGAVVLRRDGGPGPHAWVKRSGKDARTGWVASPDP